MHAVELAAGHRQVARDARAGREHDGVVPLAQLADADVDADVDAEAKLDALGDELLDAPLDEPLLDLELRNAEADEPAGRLVALVDDDVLAARARAAARTRARPGPSRRRRRCARCAAAAGCGAIQPSSQARLTIASSTCLIETASPSLISSTHAASHGAGQSRPGELGEVVRAVELLDRLLPAVAVDEVVPVRDQVAERAAVVAERHAALHAARRLLAQLDERQRADELAEVADALGRRRSGASTRFRLRKAPMLAH